MFLGEERCGKGSLCSLNIHVLLYISQLSLQLSWGHVTNCGLLTGSRSDSCHFQPKALKSKGEFFHALSHSSLRLERKNFEMVIDARWKQPDPWVTVRGKLYPLPCPQKIATRSTTNFDMSEKETFVVLSHALVCDQSTSFSLLLTQDCHTINDIKSWPKKQAFSKGLLVSP